MTEDQIERIAQTLYELDRQKSLRSHRWHRWSVGSETKHERYRARARTLLAGEDFARVATRLENQYWHAGQLIRQHLRPIPASSAHH
jgi:hypothetical protein